MQTLDPDLEAADVAIDQGQQVAAIFGLIPVEPGGIEGLDRLPLGWSGANQKALVMCHNQVDPLFDKGFSEGGKLAGVCRLLLYSILVD